MSDIPACEAALKDAAESEAKYLKIQGAAGTGKTLALAYRVAHLLDTGAPAEDICVVTANRTAAAAFSALLDALGVDAPVNVMPVHELFVEILSTESAQKATGRVPHLLTHAEEKFIMEDMKTLGMKQNRLREMLKYFYRQWTEMGDRREDYTIAVDEEQMLDFLHKLLKVERAMLYPELSNTVVHWLENESCDAHRWPHVLVDDYNNLNRASQEACERLSLETLSVAGNVNETVECREPFPYPQGFAEFHGDDAALETIKLEASLRCPQHVTAMANALALNPEMDGDDLASFDAGTPKGSAIVLKYPMPDDEITKIGEYVVALASDEQSSLDLENIGIVVPNRTWGRNIASYLRKRKVRSSLVLSDEPLGGDPRDFGKSQGLRACTALALIADNHDVVAWRSWCGYGDYLLNSLGWTGLVKYAGENDLDVLDALAQVAAKVTEPFPGAKKIGDAYRSGVKMLKACTKKTGYALLNGIKDLGMDYAGDLQNAIMPIIGDEDAATLFERVRAQLADPVFEEGHRVHIGVPGAFAHGSYHVLVYTGLVDGFIPSPTVFRTDVEDEKKARIRCEERRQFYRVTTRTDRQLVLSYFAKAPLEIAEMMKMEVRRVRVEHDVRTALLSPCDFIAEMGDAVPGAVGEIRFHHADTATTTHRERDHAEA